jgi:LemA protein
MLAPVLIGLLILAGLYVMVSYNGLVTLRQRVKNAWAQVDVQLRRRYDLILNLVETVKGYASHEREVFERVTEARAKAIAASGVEAQSGAENMLTGTLKSLFAVAENYPQLKADANFHSLQEELASTESKIAFARQFYNDTVQKMNTRVETFPSNLVARAFGFGMAEYFSLESEPEARGPVKVNFR